MANLDHIMPQPVVAPIFWGDVWVANPAATAALTQLLSDLVTGPYMNGLAQYGVQRGTVAAPITIPDSNPTPNPLIYYDTSNHEQDDITPKLIGWINAGLVPPPPSPTDINQFYFIFPPPGTTGDGKTGTTFQTYRNSGDVIGNGWQGYHNMGDTNPAPPPTYYWAIVKTNDVTPPLDGTPSRAQSFAKGLSHIVSHELVEQLADRNNSFEEIGDPCQYNGDFTYRGWSVQQYVSDWDKSASNASGCINGDNPVSLKRFLSAVGFDYTQNGVRQFGASTISLDYIAVTMQSQ
jgi:hypothetical protein